MEESRNRKSEIALGGREGVVPWKRRDRFFKREVGNGSCVLRNEKIYLPSEVKTAPRQRVSRKGGNGAHNWSPPK